MKGNLSLWCRGGQSRGIGDNGWRETGECQVVWSNRRRVVNQHALVAGKAGVKLVHHEIVRVD